MPAFRYTPCFYPIEAADVTEDPLVLEEKDLYYIAMNKRTIRNILTVAVLGATVLLFGHFFMQHPEYFRELRHVSLWVVVLVLLLNAAMITLLVAITAITLRMCRIRLKVQENFLLTSYSSIVNFFGPLQSGPGVRAVYLKAKYKIRLRDYTLASLIYYGLFAFFSMLFLLVGTRPWWQTTFAVIAVAVFSLLVIRLFMKRDKKASESQFLLQSNIMTTLIIVSFLQVLLTAVTYFVELKAVNSHITWGQAVSYAGAANFALFVSITPDAIGIRETFLVFSKHLHHVSTGNIVSANIIDRASYVIFLGILFLVVLSVHAKDKLQLTKLRRRQTEAAD